MIRPPEPAPKIAHRYRLPTYDVEVHLQGCECRHCSDRLGFAAIGNLALAAVLVGSAIAFAIDPHGAWAALVDVARSAGS